MAQENTAQDVIVQAVDVISSLQSLSETVVNTRSELQQSFSRTKEEIYSAISRQIEALRDREIWLLSRVDALREVKEQLMEEELSVITQGLCILEAKLTLLQKHPDQPVLVSDLEETLKRLKNLDCAPMEEPGICLEFHGDTLRRKIHSFGSVSSSKRPRLDQSDVTTSDSTSTLPTELEALDLKDKKELFSIFSETRPTSFWLQETKMAEVSWHSSSYSCSPFSTNLSSSYWLIKGDNNMNVADTPMKDEIEQKTLAQSSKNILKQMDSILQSPQEMWLHQGNHMDVAHTPMKDEIEQKTLAQSSKTILKQMDSILQSPQEMWLHPGICTSSQMEDRSHLDQFSDDLQEWLLFPSQDNCACIKTGDKPMDMDIENLANLICMQNHPSPAVIPESDMSSWLVKSEDKCEDVLPPIERVCRANEVCGCFTECVCDDDNCAGKMLQRSGDKNGSWLLVSGNSSSESNLGIFEKEVVLSDWPISNGNVSQSDNIKNEADLKWLCDEVTQEKQEAMPMCDEDSGLDSTVTEEKRYCPMDVLYKYHSTLSTSDWLSHSVGNNKDDGMWLLKKEDGEGMKKEDSNKWLVEDIKEESFEKEKDLQMSHTLINSVRDSIKLDPSASTGTLSNLIHQLTLLNGLAKTGL